MDRIGIINDSLLATGNEALNFEYDGSPEWTVGESAYRRAVAWALSKHRWNFATTSIDLAGLLPDSPHQVFSKAYQLPSDCLHVQAVFLNSAILTEYEIVDNKLCCRYDTGISIRYVRAPDMGQWPPMFSEIVTIKTEAGILRGLNEDTANAKQRDRDADIEIADLRTRTDQQNPPRAVFRSRSAARRRGGGYAGGR